MALLRNILKSIMDSKTFALGLTPKKALWLETVVAKFMLHHNARRRNLQQLESASQRYLFTDMIKLTCLALKWTTVSLECPSRPTLVNTINSALILSRPPLIWQAPSRPKNTPSQEPLLLAEYHALLPSMYTCGTNQAQFTITSGMSVSSTTRLFLPMTEAAAPVVLQLVAPLEDCSSCYAVVVSFT